MAVPETITRREVEALLAKLEAFYTGLSPRERALLTWALGAARDRTPPGSAAEVAGYNHDEAIQVDALAALRAWFNAAFSGLPLAG